MIRPPPNLLGDHLEYKVQNILKCNKPNQKEKYSVKWRGYHEKESTCVAAKDMMNAKKIRSTLKLGLKDPIKRSLGIDKDINLFILEKNVTNTIILEAMSVKTCHCSWT